MLYILVLKKLPQSYESDVYPIEMHVFHPEEHNLPSWNKNCHEKTCHCIAEYWLFGGSAKRGYTNESDLKFGIWYRNLYGEFIRTGELPEELKPWQLNGKNFNYMTQNDNYLEFIPIDEEICDIYDEIDKYLLF